MRRMPPLAAIRVFEAAARHENFSVAARELAMTQAAVSYQVKALEDRVGAALFVRERGRVRLTTVGQRLLPLLSSAFDTVEHAFASVRQDDEALLTISTTTTFANSWLAWRLGRFQLSYPDLAVRIETSGMLADLVGGEADVAIRAGFGDWPGTTATRLIDVNFTPMCSPAYLARVEAGLGRGLTAADLPLLLLLNPEDIWWDRWFTANGVDGGERPAAGGLRLDSQVSEGQAAMGGDGFVLLTPMFWKTDLAEGRLVQPFEVTARTDFAYWFVCASGRVQAPKIRRFRDWLLASIAG